jgi:phosphonoacetaldehyde hydrolase
MSMPDLFRGPLQALVLDWAGTVIDHGSRAPMGAFVRAFAQFDVAISIDEARGPMGMAKWDHIFAVGTLPRVSAAWTTRHGAPFGNADADRVFEIFEPMNVASVQHHTDLIPGAVEVIATARARGLKIAATTGYTRPIMQMVEPVAAAAGYAPEFTVCAGDLAAGRPSPLMMWHTMARLGVHPAAAVVKIDDTPVGIGEGIAAGTWTIGLALSGNLAGLSAEELAALPGPERDALRSRATAALHEAGAHLVIDSLADLLPALDRIESALLTGARP